MKNVQRRACNVKSASSIALLKKEAQQSISSPKSFIVG
jgi:hypothetical protein